MFFFNRLHFLCLWGPKWRGYEKNFLHPKNDLMGDNATLWNIGPTNNRVLRAKALVFCSVFLSFFSFDIIISKVEGSIQKIRTEILIKISRKSAFTPVLCVFNREKLKMKRTNYGMDKRNILLMKQKNWSINYNQNKCEILIVWLLPPMFLDYLDYKINPLEFW